MSSGVRASPRSSSSTILRAMSRALSVKALVLRRKLPLDLRQRAAGDGGKLHGPGDHLAAAALVAKGAGVGLQAPKRLAAGRGACTRRSPPGGVGPRGRSGRLPGRTSLAESPGARAASRSWAPRLFLLQRRGRMRLRAARRSSSTWANRGQAGAPAAPIADGSLDLVLDPGQPDLAFIEASRSLHA